MSKNPIDDQTLESMYQVARFELRRLDQIPSVTDGIYAGIAAAITILSQTGRLKKSTT